MPKTDEIEAHLMALFSGIDVPATDQGDTPVSIQGLKESAAARRQAGRQEALFHSLVENSIDAISVSDMDGNQNYGNRACYDLFGYDYDRQEMKDMPLSDLWPRRGVQTLTEQVLPRAKTAGGWSGETRLQRSNGDLFDAYVTVFPVMDGLEQPVGLATIVRDVSEQKALDLDRMYQHRSRQVQLVTEVAQEIAGATNLDDLYRRAVNVIKERLGYWHVQVFRHDPESNALILVETCKPEEGMEEAEQKLADARGTAVAASASGDSILIPDVRQYPRWVPYPDLPNVRGELAVPIKRQGRVLGVLDVLSNKPDTLAREDEILLTELAGQIANAIQSTRLLEEADFLRRFADSSEGIGWITLEGSLFIYVNPTLSNMLGEARPENAFGKSILSYYPEDLRQRVRDEILPTAIREGQWVGELSLRSTWGKNIPTMQSIFLVRDDSGEPTYLANVVTDISEQKQAESVAYRRIRQMACLNDIGRKIETGVPVADFLQWVIERVPSAMEHPKLCAVAIGFAGDAQDGRTFFGPIEVTEQPTQIVEDLIVCGEVAGRMYVSYSEEQPFSTEDKTLIGDIARRVSNYVESYRLSEQAQVALEEVRSAHKLYVPEQWAKRVPEQAPADKPAPVEPDAVRDVGARARAKLEAYSRNGVRKKLHRLLQRASTRLFILALGAVVLACVFLVTGFGFRVRGGPPTPTADAVARLSYVSDAPSAPLPTSTVVPVVLPVSTQSATSSSPSTVSLVTPSSTPVPTLTSTPLPISVLALSPTPAPDDAVTPQPFPMVNPTITSTLPLPAPVQPVPVATDAINIVVLGSDRRPDWKEWHTDAVHVVSIQRDSGVVSVLSVPRDLYLYIPGFWMSRINFADMYGELYGYEGGGPALVRDTLLYNLGIRVDYYVRTNFDGLIGIVDTLGGIDVPVHCGVEDHWPYPDEDGEYPILTMEPGVQHMDGETALWYSRSRLTTSTFSREGRQQQVLQALWHKVRNDMTLSQIPSLWEQGNEMVTTDLALQDILALAPMALALEDRNVRYYSIGYDQVTPWTTPTGGAVYLPRWELIEPIVAEAMAPVPEGRLAYVPASIEVWNGTSNEGWDVLAADRLGRAGFPAVIGEPDRQDYAVSTLFFFGESTKGSGIDYLQQVFGIPDDHVFHRPGGSSTFGMRLIVGADYQTCQ